MYQRKKRVKVQKMAKKCAKSLKNLLIRVIVYTFFMKKKFYFFIFFKPRYNWYNFKKLVIPTLNCSNLYQDPLVQLGTIGTIEKLMLIIKAYLSKIQIIVVYQQLKGRAHMNHINKFIFYKSWSIQTYA